MSKELVLGKVARERLIAGAEKMCTAVASTLGPFGKNVIMKRHYNPPYVTKDGVTVARELRLLDQVEDIGLLMIREAAKNTAENSGDGTTTSTLLAYTMLKAAQEVIEKDPNAFMNISKTKENFKKWVISIIEFIKENEITYESLDDLIVDIARISTNNDEDLYENVAKCYIELGRNAEVALVDSLSNDITYELHKGMYFEGGFTSKEFVTDKARNICELEKVMVLVTDLDIIDFDEIKELARRVLGATYSLLIIAPNVSGEAFNKLARAASVNKNLCVVKAPGVNVRRHELLEDIAIFTSGKVIKGSRGETIKDVGTFQGVLGIVDRVIIKEESTTLIGGGKDLDRVKERVQYLENEVAKIVDPLRRKRWESRISNFVGGVGVIYVGANSEPELKEKKDRLDDAICAVKSALTEGVVNGGGHIFDLFADINKEELMKSPEGKVIYAGLKAPKNHIWRVNGGTEPPEDYVNYLLESKVVDPIMVLKDCIKNSVSVVHSILSTNVIVIDDKESTQILGDMPQIEEIVK